MYENSGELKVSIKIMQNEKKYLSFKKIFFNRIGNLALKKVKCFGWLALYF